MKWPKTRWSKRTEQKLNPAQEEIVMEQGTSHWSSADTITNEKAFQEVVEVQRGVSLIVDSCAEINVDVKDKIQGLGITENIVKPNKINKLLNYEPNPYIDINQFRSNIYIDLLIQGDAFIYWDGAHLYNLPASNVDIIADEKTYISHYMFGETKFLPSEIIHIKEANAKSIYRGASRLDSAGDHVKLLGQMYKFQSTFFRNGTVSNIVLQTENILGAKIKDRIRFEWARRYSAERGGKVPIILDGNYTIKTLGAETLKELDFELSIGTNKDAILEALGVPKVLITSGNNANISPNISLFYLTTILPLVNRTTIALERFFGYDLKANTADVLALRPELAQLSGYYSTLVNSGVLTINEARVALRYPKEDSDIANMLIKPANVAGSALDETQGGRPVGSDEAVEPENTPEEQ